MNKKVKLRTILIGGLFTLFFIVLIGKIYWVQVVDASELLKKAQEMWERNKTIQPVRGSIVDRNKQVLAEDGPSYTVIVNPKIIDTLKNGSEVVKQLSAILGKPESELMEQVTKKKEDGTLLTWVEVRSEGWKIDVETADKIAAALKLEQPVNSQSNLYTHGVYLEETPKRYYPGGSLAAHVLGYFDKNGKAVMGLEATYNDMLKGKPGHIITARDRMGYELPDAKASYEPAEDGKTLQLTIDRNIQSYIETALERSYAEFKPKSMTAIAMDPKTGEILGLANLPTFNPAKYWEAKPEDFRNNAISSQFEPGSTFKLVTLAGTVEEGLFDPNEKFKSGSIKIYDRTLNDHNLKGWGTITYLEGLKRSSNVAFVKLGYEKLKEEKFKQYIGKFGFGQKTGIDLPGEITGWGDRFRYPVDYATATYGQGGVSVTAIQQIAAYGAIANGGMMMQPHVVKAVLDPKTNETIQKVDPKAVRQVVSPETASKVTEYLEQVVSDKEMGTGRNAYIDGYRVAGKTGTANIVINGKYSDDKWVITFVGYAPVEDPKIVVLVLADQPDLHGNYHNGGLVAPVVFKEIMSQSLRYMNVTAHVTQELSGVEKKVATPDVAGKPIADAKKQLGDGKIKYDVLGKGAGVIAQFPPGGTEIGPNQRIYLLTEETGGVELPNLQGKSLRDALAVCSFMKVECQVSGEGYVASQTVAPSGEQQAVTLQLVPWNDLEKAIADAAKQTAAAQTASAGKPPQTSNARSQSGSPSKAKP
ncbi:PASTA domain-containing protein [Paenibacillus mesophilus]|uniref:penicillin-binding transpeptidase domain-containing protein n=1 Tax=Paenibacillus mesophilus TaxID=2582849 RepID=UPI00110F3442|nr:penicillin-binding transpeptidase domain-containing protein [Paenibacillus mesophilus]TMV46666.1 PASTA domain-containing protein [Paenibacillus mesophilus]